MDINVNMGSRSKDQLPRTVYVQDFDDNYHRTSDQPSSELEREARRIRRRYRRISDFVYAKAIYNEYMEYMFLKHGGKDLFKIKLEDDLIDDFIPAKPRLRNSAHLRSLAKRKIITSNVDLGRINKVAVSELADLYNGENDSPDPVIDERDFMNKDVFKIAKKINLNQTTKISASAMDPFAYLEEYFKGKNKMIKETQDKELSKLTVTDIIEGNYEMIEDTEEESATVFFNGQYMRREIVDELRTYNRLGELGWDHIKLMKHKGVSNKITKIARKQDKRNKKKKKGKKEKRKQQDDFIMQTIFDNDMSFADFKKDMEDGSFNNIFK